MTFPLRSLLGAFALSVLALVALGWMAGCPQATCDGTNCDDAVCDGDAQCADAEDCNDGTDNDGDGDEDCADSDCANDAACTGGCGNSTIDGTEQCDGTELDGASCESQGFASGTLACNADCTFNTTGCAQSGCGDGVPDPNEQCDDGNTDNSDACVACQNARCGDGFARTGDEDCDGTDLAGATCASLGLTGGNLACAAGCVFDTAGCDVQPICGDGDVNGGEQCEPPSQGNCGADCRFLVELCDDATDNDNDGLSDCDDLDCLGDAACPQIGSRIVDGTSLRIEDVKSDGSSLAYLDGTTLFVVSTNGGQPEQIATNVDKARFKGDHLVVFHGVDVNGIAASVEDKLGAGAIEPLDTDVKVSSVQASPDGAHLYWEKRAGDPALGLEDLYLDGVRLLQNAHKEETKFTSTSSFLVVAVNLDDGTGAGGGFPHTVRSFSTAAPVADGITLEPDNCVNKIDLSHDGARAIAAINEDTFFADLVSFPVGGGNPIALATQIDEAGWRVLPDDSGVVYLAAGAVASAGDLHFVSLNGQTDRLVLAGSIADVGSTSNTHTVYTTAIDAVNGLRTLRMVKLDGTGDLALGSQAEDGAFTTDGAHYLFTDQVSNGVGRLRSVNTSTGALSALGTAVQKSSLADDATAFLLDTAGTLRRAVLDEGAAATYQSGVGTFDKVRDGPGLDASRVAYAITTGGAAGIYIAPAK